jgi:hypothetical protein
MIGLSWTTLDVTHPWRRELGTDKSWRVFEISNQWANGDTKQYTYHKANGHPALGRTYEHKDLFQSSKNAILCVSHTMKNIIGFYGFWPSCAITKITFLCDITPSNLVDVYILEQPAASIFYLKKDIAGSAETTRYRIPGHSILNRSTTNSDYRPSDWQNYYTKPNILIFYMWVFTQAETWYFACVFPTLRSSGQHSCFVFGRSRFISRPGDRQSWLKTFVVLRFPPRKRQDNTLN